MKQIFLVGLLCTLGALVPMGCTTDSPKASAVTIRWSRDPESLDPLLLPNQQAIDAANLLHQSLLQADFATQKFSPALVDSLPQVRLIGDSLMRLSYHLRPAAAWDSGQPLSGHDVAFTLKLLHCPGLPNEGLRAQFGFIRAVEVDAQDSRRFTLVCRGQAPDYVQASGDFFILSEAALDPQHQLRHFTLAQLQDRPATALPDSALSRVGRRYLASVPMPGRPAAATGCGAYELLTWDKDHALRFRRKARWWAANLQPAPLVLQAQPTQLEFAIIPDETTATLALQRGEVDVFPQVPAAIFARLRRSVTARKKLAFYTALSYDVVTAGFNTRRPALADRLTRQALSRLFDTENLLRATQLGEGKRTIGLIHPTDKLRYNDSLTLLPYAPAQAAALLRQAGWQQPTATGTWHRKGPNGAVQQLTLTFRYRADDTSFETIALQFRAAASQLGIPVALQPTESSALTPALQQGDFDMYVRLVKGNPFIFNFKPILHSQAAGNFTGYGSPASDQLIDAIAAARQPVQQARLLRKFQALLQADAPFVPLFFVSNRVAASKQLTDLHVTGLKPGYSATAIRRLPATH